MMHITEMKVWKKHRKITVKLPPKACGIYIITHKRTKRFYIGASIDIQHRIRMHMRGAEPSKIGRAIQKYGSHSFSFDALHLCPMEKLGELERHYVETMNPHFNQQANFWTMNGLGKDLKSMTRIQRLKENCAAGIFPPYQNH